MQQEKIPTPKKSDHTSGRITKITSTGRLARTNKDKTKEYGIGLADYVEYGNRCPTPTCSDAFTDKLKSSQQKPGSMHSVTLSQKVQWAIPTKYPTPVSTMYKGSSKGSMTRKNGDSREGDRLDFAIEKGEGKLNPDWCELLIMWPKGWTRLERQEINIYDWYMGYNFSLHYSTAWEQDVPRVTTIKEHRPDRLKCIGNGQVPFCMAGAFLILNGINN